MPVTIIFSRSETFRSYVKSLLERNSTVIEVSDDASCLNALEAHAGASLVLDVHSKLPAFACNSLTFLDTMNQKGFGKTRVAMLSWLSPEFIFLNTQHSPVYSEYLSTDYRNILYFFILLPTSANELFSALGIK